MKKAVNIQALSLGNTIAGFTLAEVLITLVIIGVIAALTIPSLITSIEDAQLKSQWKASYSILSQAIQMTYTENGGTIQGVCSSGDQACFRNLVLSHLNYIKKCDYGQTLGNCFHNSIMHAGNPWTPWNRSGVILSNGSLMDMSYDAPACNPVCGWVYLDVNGWKGPNTTGKDIGEIEIENTRIEPRSSNPDTLGCAAKYLTQ